MERPLAGRRVWLTRPAHRMEAWAAPLEAAGAIVRREPLMTIERPADPEAAHRGLVFAEAADDVLATSANAVRLAWRLKADFAPRGRLYAVGAATAEALEAASGRPVARPQAGFSSEALLALPSLVDLNGRRAALLAGAGGRRTLAETLAARGAQVTKIVLYARRPAAIAPERLRTLLADSDAVVVTSGEALSHLIGLAGGALRPVLARLRLVAPSTRVVKQAGHGPDWIREPVVVDRMSGDAVVAALARVWRSERQ